MKVRDFEKRIKHLSQEQVSTGSQSALNRLLVEKGIITVEELQQGLLTWMQEYGLEAPKKGSKKNRKRAADASSDLNPLMREQKPPKEEVGARRLTG